MVASVSFGPAPPTTDLLALSLQWLQTCNSWAARTRISVFRLVGVSFLWGAFKGKPAGIQPFERQKPSDQLIVESGSRSWKNGVPGIPIVLLVR